MIHVVKPFAWICLSFFITFPLSLFAKTVLLSNKFVKLSEAVPDVYGVQRYATANNFLNRPVVGYQHGDIYCTLKAAKALAKVNSNLNKLGYGLLVYDAYRPQRAVDSFIAWSQSAGDQLGKSHYYPSLPKQDLFDLGYLLKKSGHSRGSTIDLTLIPLTKSPTAIQYTTRVLSNGERIPYLDDGSVDMGSSFDLFHPVSHFNSQLITPQQASMRQLLRDNMLAAGFNGIEEEWWHYTLAKEPYPDRYFDFIT